MAQRAGWEVQADVNGVPYTFSEFRFSDESPELETTNSEGDAGPDEVGAMTSSGHTGFATSVSGPRKGKLMVKRATYDDSDDPFDLPVQLFSSKVVAVKIYPAGRANPLIFHDLPRVRLASVVHEGQTTGLSPVTFEGTTDGRYTLANQ